MTSITIRRLDEGIKMRLRIRAGHHGHSMQEEAREILKAALAAPAESHIVDSIRRRANAVGGIELAIPPREPLRDPPELDIS